MRGYYTERCYRGDMPYTDLALERRRADTSLPGVEYSEIKTDTGTVERIKISSKIGAESIGRPMGIYDSLSSKRFDLIDSDCILSLTDRVAAMLGTMLEDSEIFPGRILVAGLGNPTLTPDSLGCLCAGTVKPTAHVKDMDRRLFGRLKCAEISVITPGVMATTGMDATVVLKGICDLIRPDAVVAIDSLCTRSAERLGSTVQISNTGISPGSGIGNPRLPISKETLGVPVISIGIPTVIDSRVLSSEDSSLGEPMMVCPKEINDIVSVGAEIIGKAINQAFGIYP
jgi:spore protease